MLDRQYQGEQQMSEPTANKPHMEYIGLSRDGATGRISGNMLQGKMMDRCMSRGEKS